MCLHPPCTVSLLPVKTTRVSGLHPSLSLLSPSPVSLIRASSSCSIDVKIRQLDCVDFMLGFVCLLLHSHVKLTFISSSAPIGSIEYEFKFRATDVDKVKFENFANGLKEEIVQVTKISRYFIENVRK